MYLKSVTVNLSFNIFIMCNCKLINNRPQLLLKDKTFNSVTQNTPNLTTYTYIFDIHASIIKHKMIIDDLN